MAQAITIPQLQVNGVYIPIVPNSLIVRRGKGTRVVKAQANGSYTEPVYQQDLTEAVGEVQFSIYPVSDVINQMQIIQDNYDNNVVQVTATDYSVTLASASITNDPNYELGADKTIAITMMGAEAV